MQTTTVVRWMHFPSPSWGMCRSQCPTFAGQNWARIKHIHHACLTVLKTIRGKGSTATVFAGTLNGDTVAVKAMLCEELSPDDLRKYCYEILIANELQGHVNVVQHLGFSLAPPHMYVVMESCETNLHDLLHGSPIHNSLAEALPDAARWQLAHGVSHTGTHLHSKCFIHRDIKSPNFLVQQSDRFMQAKLCDFGETIVVGAAAADGGMDDEGSLIGTANWAAPDLMRTPRLYSQASDVYALALVCFECIGQRSLSSFYGVVGPAKQRKYYDFCEWMEAQGPPSLERHETEWGDLVCAAVNNAWRSDPDDRCTAKHLDAALEACPLHSKRDQIARATMVGAEAMTVAVGAAPEY